MNRRVLLFVAVLLMVAPALASAQASGMGISVQGALGTHVNRGGDTESIAVGFSPNARVAVLIGAERLYQPTDLGAFGATRGGTTTFVSGEVRFAPFSFDRVSPYVLVSAGRGISRPNVNETFPDRVTNDAWLLLFAGGGVHVPVTKRLGVFADMRFGFQGERDTISLLMPVRGGIAWRF